MVSLVAICHRCAPGQRTCPQDGEPLHVHAEEKFCALGYFTDPPERLLHRAKIETTCIYREAETRRVLCTGCKGNHVMLKVFACPKHGECSLSSKVDGVKFCGGCADRED